MSASPIDPSKRVAVITGCSEYSSLGAAFALELLSRDWTVFATARNESTLTRLAEAGCRTLKLDVTCDESVSAAAQTISTLTGGRVDLLINNAGALAKCPLLSIDPSKFAMIHDLHVLGPLRLAQALFPYLRQTAQSSGKRSKIVNIGSVVSHGFPWHAAYASTKAGIQVMSDVMRLEFAPFGIDVITLELGLVQTAMTAGTKDFPLESKDVEVSYDGKKAVEASAEDMKRDVSDAPFGRDVARDLIDVVEKARSPGKIWLGKHHFLFHWIVPYLPIFLADLFFSKLGRVNLVRP